MLTILIAFKVHTVAYDAYYLNCKHVLIILVSSIPFVNTFFSLAPSFGVLASL